MEELSVQTLDNGIHRPLGTTQVIESIHHLFMVFKEVLVLLVLQLDVLRLLVLGGELREVFPNCQVPVLIVSEFPLGPNVMG